MSPVVSVIMSVYGEPEEWLRESINSILEQTFRDFEFIIVNDNPGREANWRVLGEYVRRDGRVVVLHNEENIGLTRSLNRGLEVARGKYVARMDADDISLPRRFEKQVAFLEEHLDVGVCGANIRLFGCRKGEQKYPERDEDCFLFQGSPFAHPMVMIRASVLKDNGLFYNPDFRYAQDYELWSRMKGVTCFHNLQEVLLKYRVTNKQITSKNHQSQQRLAAKIRRKGFCSFCQRKSIAYELTEKLALKQLLEFKKVVLPAAITPGERKAIKYFYYYLYRSITASSGLQVLLYLVCSGDFKRFSIMENAKIVVYNIFRNRIIPML